MNSWHSPARRAVGILAVISLLLNPVRLFATDKYWMAHEAELVVVGTFRQGFTYPWIDGWHVAGTVEVDETLLGPPTGHLIKYRYVCRWDVLCRYLPPPRFRPFFTEKGIWFLCSGDRRTWGPPRGGGTDPGFRALSQRRDFEKYIRLYRR
jgi:hypothetical protein